MPGGSRPRRTGVRSAYAREPEAAAPDDEELLDVDLSTSTGGRPLRSSSRRLFHGATETTTSSDDDVAVDGGGDSHGDGDDDPWDDTPGTSSSSAAYKPYQRGPSSLHDAPLLDRRPVIRPVGAKGWVVLPPTAAARHPNGTQGLLIRKHHPGLVNGSVPFKWKNFYEVQDADGEVLAEKIKREFWLYFRCAEGVTDARKDKQQEVVCKDRLKDLYYESRLQAFIDYYANKLGQTIKKPVVRQRILNRETDLTEEQYLQVCPGWLGTKEDCWEQMVRAWTTDEAYEARRERRERRLANPPVAHKQGNVCLPVYMDKWTAAHPGRDINEYMGYALAHRGRANDPSNVYDPAEGPEAYTNPNVYEKLAQYTAAARQRHGPDFDPTTAPLDPELVMRIGGGKQHGRLALFGNVIDEAPTLSEIRRADAEAGGSQIPIAPRQQSSAQQMAALQATVAQLLANQEAQARVYDQNLAALSQHYQQVHADTVGYFRSQMPGSQEPPPSIFAPPPVPLPIPVHAPGPNPSPSAGSNPTPNASPPPRPSPPQGYPAYSTFPTQPFMWHPPTSHQGYSSWPAEPTQQGYSGPPRGPAPPYMWHGTYPQSGWSQFERGGGSGTPGDDAQS